MMNMKKTVLLLAIASVLIAGTALAQKIYLNGVDITGVKNKQFNKVKVVRIDADGNMFLDAPQYEVKVMESGGSTSSNSAASTGGTPPSGQYFIATQGRGKQAQYDLVVNINGVDRLVIKASNSANIEEITKWLHKGENIIEVTAQKDISGGRLSTDKEDELTLLIGKGHEENKIVKIDALKATFKCDASKLTNFTRRYTIKVN